MNNPLKDREFLAKLDQAKNKKTYARITALNWQEQPLEYIEGRITGGSINIDGASAVRRTCSLNMVAEDINYNNYYWGINNKIKIEIGIENILKSEYSNYPEIIWFPQGLYVLTTFNTTQNANNYTISLSGKDKMCLLNGDVSGSLNSSIDFGTESYYDKITNTTTYTKIPLKQIILNAVNVYGQEPYHNIIIKDLDTIGYELLTYKGSDDTPIYLFRQTGTDSYINMTLNGDMNCYVKGYVDETNDMSPIPLKKLESVNGYKYDDRISGLGPGEYTEGTTIYLTKNITDNSIGYQVSRIGNNETVGYRITDLTYAGDLISKVGESLTSILDKIKNMLGNFEYFYDLDGHFIFQKKKNNIYQNWNPLIELEGDTIIDPLSKPIDYTFYNSELIASISHTPNFTNLKNDFSIWGERQGINGDKLPVHYRCALDKKPIQYQTIRVSDEESLYCIDTLGWPFTPSSSDLNPDQLIAEKKSKYAQKSELISITNYDWREIIYRMAKDYFQYNQLDDFLFKVATANSHDYPSGATGYEQYYTDLQGFWRELYNPEFIVIVNKNQEPNPNFNYYTINNNEYILQIFYEKDNKESIVELKNVQNGPYYSDTNDTQYDLEQLKTTGFIPGNIYYIKNNNKYELFNIYKWKDNNTIYYQGDKTENYYPNSEYQFWNKKIIENPSTLNFWFDFIGESTLIDPYLVPNIGDRSKSLTDKDVQAIYFKDTPNVVFIKPTDYNSIKAQYGTGYTYIQVSDYLNSFFNISSQGKSAHDVLEQLLQDNTYCTETVNITSIPIYYLQPNTRIALRDSKSGIEGEFIVSKITIPLTYNGMMSIAATRAADTIY